MKHRKNMWGARKPFYTMLTALLMFATFITWAALMPSNKQDPSVALASIVIFIAVLSGEALLFRYMYDGKKPTDVWRQFISDVD